MTNGSVIFINCACGKEWNGPMGRTGCICRVFTVPFVAEGLGSRMSRNWMNVTGDPMTRSGGTP
jgi:hypothetical protein